MADPGPSLSFAWRRCGAAGAACPAISSAIGPGDLPAADDVGHTLRVRITATHACSSATSTSAPSYLVAATVATSPVALPQPLRTEVLG